MKHVFIICLLALLLTNVTQGQQKLFRLYEKGDLDKFKEAIIKEPELVNSKTDDGYNILSVVVGNNAMPYVEFLINNKADVNIKNIDEVTPLMIASGKGYKTLVEYLISKGANLNIKGKKRDIRQ